MERGTIDVLAVYERYLACCNAHRVEDLGQFVAYDVGGSAPDDGLEAFVEGVAAVVRGLPDYHWDLQETVVQGDTVCARLVGRGTHTGTFSGIAPTGRVIEVQELVVYRFADGKIVRCWGDLYPVLRDALTSTAAS